MNGYMVLIPSYKPDEKLVELMRQLKAKGLLALVVDDGGGSTYEKYFEEVVQLGFQVIHHAVNLGKGRALKTGFNEILLHYTGIKGVVTADSDGQHSPEDIIRVMEAMHDNPNTLVIGARDFTGKVPLRSKFGNNITKLVFKFATGQNVNDTQTGLRGIPAEKLGKMILLSGEKYEFEMNMLLAMDTMDLKPHDVPIQTIYIDNNAGSHFDPLMDSIRIYRLIVGYTASSVASWLVDYGIYFLLRVMFKLWITPWLCHAIARIPSSIINYKLNRKMVFKANGGRKVALRYFMLVGVTLALGSLMINYLVSLGLSGIRSKIIVDVFLFFINFSIQRDLVFRKRKIWYFKSLK